MQAQYGGRLGSILVELGVLEVDVLAVILGKQLGVHAALQKHFDLIDRASIKLIPAKLAEKREAIPLGWSTRQAKTLLVVFANPRELAAVEEVAFAASARIQACVAPEVRIRSALSRYYDVASTRRRFVAMDARAPVEGESEPPVSAKPSPAAAPSRASATNVTLSMPPPTPEPPPISIEREVRAQSLHPVLTLDEAIEAIEGADDRERVGDAITDFLAMHFRAALILIVKDNKVRGWKGFAPFVEGEALESLVLPLDRVPLVKQAFDSKQPQMGACDGPFRDLLRCNSKNAAAIPIVVHGRVINVVYGQGEPGAELDAVAIHELHQVCAAATDAYLRILRARVA